MEQPPDLPALLQSIHSALTAHEEEINDLNVFPVPDGDTGTNVLFTFESGMRRVPQGPSDLAKQLELLGDGCLLGSRGNSGVLLAQMVKGFAEALSGGAAFGLSALPGALASAYDRAYASLDEPCEGTMLTVMRVVAEAAAKADESFMLKAMTIAAQDAVLATTGQLAALREAGVVDAGGYALALMLTAVVRFFGVDVPWQVLPSSDMKLQIVTDIGGDTSGMRYRFCTEYVLSGAPADAEEELRLALQESGDCVMVVGGDAFFKIHVHTNAPDDAVALGESLGTVSATKINDMVLEAQERRERLSARDTVAVLAVASGDGVSRLLCGFAGVGVIDEPDKGNLSTEAFLRAIETIPQQRVLLMPNNRNVMAAAEQAASLSEKTVAVVTSYSIPEALSALIVFDDQSSFADNVDAMSSAARTARWGAVTRAARARQGLTLGGYFSLAMGVDVLPASGFVEAGLALADILGGGKSDIITIIVGNSALGESVSKLVKALRETYPRAEIELHHGGQIVYELYMMVG